MGKAGEWRRIGALVVVAGLGLTFTAVADTSST